MQFSLYLLYIFMPAFKTIACQFENKLFMHEFTFTYMHQNSDSFCKMTAVLGVILISGDMRGLIMWQALEENQRINGPVNAHLISWPTISTKQVSLNLTLS